VVAETSTQGPTTCDGTVARRGAGGLESVEEGKRNLETRERKRREKEALAIVPWPSMGPVRVYLYVRADNDKYARAGRVR
jgi:hypothetical protein